jgi:RNA polymerase sigma factor (sigma-70 family)
VKEDAVATEATLERARSGDDRAFGELTGPYRGELQLHCYRILGSMQDAEDVLQETLPAAWRGLGQYEGRASLRTWLYRIATNRCLNALRASSRRPRTEPSEPSFLTAEPTRRGDAGGLAHRVCGNAGPFGINKGVERDPSVTRRALVALAARRGGPALVASRRGTAGR